MIKIKTLKEIFENFEAAPVLFVGAGLSRRYLGLGNWEDLLREMAKLVKDNELTFEKYSQKAKNNGFKVGEHQKIAELIEFDVSDLWYEDPKFENSRKNYKDFATQKVSPFKIEIAKYVKENEFNLKKEYDEEIKLFKHLGKKSITAVITTNYDNFIERALVNYKTYVGQEELIFSSIQGVGEIYKIHGCCDDPKSIVINEKDYLEFEEKNAYLAAKILTIFLEHPIIFLGYSIEDNNIKKILKSIVKCLSKEKLASLKKRLIFVEWNDSNKCDKISTHSISFEDDKTLEMTRVYIKDFSILYRTLLENKFKYNIPVLRRLKEEIYDLVVSNEPTTKMKVIEMEDNVNLDNVEFVIGVGVLSKFGEKGYSGLKVEDIFEDILFDKKEFDANLVVTKSLTILLKHNSGSVPMYKYLSKTTSEIPEYVKEKIKRNYNEFLSQTMRKEKTKNSDKYKSIDDIINDNKDSKILELIPLLGKDNIEVEKLGDFLKKYYERYNNIFSSGTSSDKTNFRRLVRIYDWLKYYNNTI